MSDMSNQKTAKWIKVDMSANKWECSECGKKCTLNHADATPMDEQYGLFFCPNCGSRMFLEDKES